MQTEDVAMTSRSLRSILSVEPLNDRILPSGVIPANGQEMGTTTRAFIADLQAAGYRNLGDYCSDEGGECAAETLAFISPPGQR
jgi:hypothetical protein